MASQTGALWGREKTRKFQDRLLTWYSLNKRRLPWRSRPTPYRIWVSEVMLQQTQVSTVIPYFRRFVERFPDIETLAQATEVELLQFWSGLGYYSRARNLLRAARKITTEFSGRFPRTLEGIQALPGVGRYTAGAIYSIAFNKPAPVVDGNVRRVITRLHAFEDPVPEAFFWKQASAWTDQQRAADFNQAVMELGAIVCTAVSPHCAECPAQSLCKARIRGIENAIPRTPVVSRQEQVELVILVLQSRNHTLLARQAAGTFIPGEWGLPTERVREGIHPCHEAERLASGILGRSIAIQPCPVVRHAITHRRIIAHVYRAILTKWPACISGAANLRKVGPGELHRCIVSSIYRKALQNASLKSPVG